jgi:hypothetical protein
MTAIIPMFFYNQSYGFDYYLKGSMATDIFSPPWKKPYDNWLILSGSKNPLTSPLKQ